MSDDFYQSPPALADQWAADASLRSLLRRLLPADVLEEVEPSLARMGALAAGALHSLGERAEAVPPRHRPYDAWGRRTDDIVVSEAWRALDRLAAEEGVVATAYERRHGSLSRVHQFALLYLFAPSSATYSCPLAMTDGAARVLELSGASADDRAAFARLTSRDPARFWTSGQWMTERTGGSDVSATSTVARRDGDGWRLWGTKWFTSATTSQMALTLARADGTEGLSLFAVEPRDATGVLRGVRVDRLKEKLGTKALPTAELTLDGVPARMIGEPGRGVRTVASLLNVTRLYNACCAAAGMRRALALAADYARRRVAFGRPIIDHPLHAETLAAMAVECDAATQLVFRAAELLGREECGVATPDERLVLRALTPIVKLYTAKQATAVASEALEAFGGAGYVEDTGLPRLLRDAQVLSIWEGTTNVLSLDLLRAIERDGALVPFLADARHRLDGVRLPELAGAAARTADALGRIERHAAEMARLGRESAEAGARAFAFALARTYAATLLLEHAEWAWRSEGDHCPATVARRWCAGELAPLVRADEAWRGETGRLVARG
jgi:alkylation response protein AidB-like acyl-CoA dehydrogenase